MEHVLWLVLFKDLFEQLLVGHRALIERDVFGNRIPPPGRKIVNTDDSRLRELLFSSGGGSAFGGKLPHEIGADKPGAPGDKDGFGMGHAFTTSRQLYE